METHTMPKTIPKKRRRYEHSAYSNLSATTNLRFEAETPSVIHNAFAHPGNVLCRSVRSVTQNGQRRRVCGSLTHAIHTCNSSREKEARHQFLDHNVSSTTYLRMNHIVKILPCQLQITSKQLAHSSGHATVNCRLNPYFTFYNWHYT